MEYVNIKTFQKTKFLFVEYRRVEISYILNYTEISFYRP